MDRQMRLMETLAEGLLRYNGGPPNDFQWKLEGFLKLRPPTFDSSDDTPSPPRTSCVRWRRS
jgi:hypothetical protein